jgi:hypothetical protein
VSQLLPYLQHDLPARVPASDLGQCLACLIQGQHRLDLGAQPARID